MPRAQSPFVPSHADMVSNPKLIALCDRLEIRRHEGVGIIHLMWHWASEHSPDDGAITCSPAALADAVYFPGEPRKLWDGLIAEGWLDLCLDGVARVHEWRTYRQDYQVLTKKRSRDRERLRRLREQEQLALEPPEPIEAPASHATMNHLSEAMRLHIVLMGEETSALPNDLRRIERTIEQFPRQEPYDIALNYMAWQIDVARAYREHKRGPTPHTDTIKGWSNQVRMHARKGWTLRTGNGPVTTSNEIEISAEDIIRYHASNRSDRTA